MKFHLYSNSGPLVILIHGFPNDHHIWDSQIAALTKQYQVVAVDLYDSESKSGATSLISEKHLDFDQLILQLDAKISEMHWHSNQSPIYIVGHDMGCFFANEISQKGELKISGQILINGKSMRHYLLDLSSPTQFCKSLYVWLLQLPLFPYVMVRYRAQAIIKLIYAFTNPTAIERAKLFAGSNLNWILIYRQLIRAGIRRLFSPTEMPSHVRTTIIEAKHDPFLAPTTINTGMEIYGRNFRLNSLTTDHWAPVTSAALITQTIINQLNHWEYTA